MSRAHRLAPVVALASACVLGDVDLTGKACPCASGWVCDETGEVCVPDGSGEGDAGAPADGSGGVDVASGLDASTRDASPADGGPADGAAADAGDAGDAGPPETCSLDGQCGDPRYVCEAQRCVLRCDAAGAPPCQGTSLCNVESGRCVPGALPIGADCGIHAQCTSRLCLTVTAQAGTQSFCSTPCSKTSDCSLGAATCLDLEGMGFCVRAQIFATPPPLSTPSGGMCTDLMSTCHSLVCDIGNMRCVERCSRTADCTAFGGNCWLWAQTNPNGTSYDLLCLGATGTAVGTACTTNDNCQTNLCNRYTGTCSAPCCSNEDCALAESCTVYDIDATHITRVCRPRASVGTGAYGQPCTAPGDCESEVCAPASFEGPEPRACSTSCCTNADCNIFAQGGLCWPLAGPVSGTLVGTCIPN